MKSRDSSQPEQAIEPSEVMFKIKKVNIKAGSEGDAADKAEEVHCIQSSDLADHADSSVKEDEVLSPANEEKQDFLVPVKLQSSRKGKKGKDTSALLSQFKEVIREVDTTQKMLEFFKRENEAARQHELKLFQLMFGQQLIPSGSTTLQHSALTNTQQQTTPVTPMQQPIPANTQHRPMPVTTLQQLYQQTRNINLCLSQPCSGLCHRALNNLCLQTSHLCL